MSFEDEIRFGAYEGLRPDLLAAAVGMSAAAGDVKIYPPYDHDTLEALGGVSVLSLADPTVRSFRRR